MSFDPDAYLAKKVAPQRAPGQDLSDLPPDNGGVAEFNPDAYLSKFQTEPETSLGDRFQTGLESFGNAVTLGYLPQLQAVAEKIMPNPNREADAQLEAQGFILPEQNYVNMRDENIMRQEAQAERNPYSAIGGTVAGAVVSAPVIGAAGKLAGLGKATGGLARLKDSAKVGAALGAVANPGDMQGTVSPLQAIDRLKGAGTGGALGVAGQGLGEGVAKIGNTVKNSPAVMDTVSKVKAFKAMGAMLKDFRVANGQNAPEEIGETLLKKNIVNAGDTLETMAEKAGVARKEVGQTIRGVYSQVREAINYTKTGAVKSGLSAREQKLLDVTKLDGNKLAESALGKLNKNFKNNLDNSEAKKRVLDVVENLKGMGDDIDLQDLIDARINLDESINYSKKLMEQPVVQQQLKTVRDTLHKAIQNRVRVVGKVVKDKELINQLRTANKEYGHLATAERVAKDKIARESANRFFSLGDRLTSGAGASIGAMSGDSPEERVRNGLIGLVGGAVAGKAGRYSLPVVSRSAQKLGNALKLPANFAKYGEPLIEAAKRSPEEFQALINQFGKDPEFIKLSTQGAR